MTATTAAYNRIRPYATGEVEVSADAYWELLTDWPAILDWMRITDGLPVPLVKVELAPGHSVDRLPCTRNCYFDTSALPPGVIIPDRVPETLLHRDPIARTIYYNMEGVGPFGLRNYLAITEVDEVAPGRTQVTCSGRFDLPADAPAQLVQGVIEGVYHSIIHDIAVTAARR